MNTFTRLVSVAAVTSLLATGCSGADDTDGEGRSDQTASPASNPSPRPTASTGPTTVALPVEAGADLEGLVKVAGHDLAVHCTGSGKPTVVILHGWIDEPGISSDSYYGPLRDELDPDFRFCSYDRANVGNSQVVKGTQTPEMVVGDLDRLMEALGDAGPYVLIGQSAGGMVASAYAVAHPDKVTGIVMVDADFDEEIRLENQGLVPDGMGACDPENRRLDGHVSLQKIDVCAMYRWAYERRADRPEVPLVYLAAKQAPWNAVYADLGPAYAKAIVPLQKSYAASWSPGRFQWVNSGHEIHSENPGVVGDAVRWVVKESR